jgi:putative transposase
MKYDPKKHHRRSIRLPGYDYTQPGAYFVTVCTQNRECLFDDPVLRSVVETYWRAIPRHAPHVALDAWVVMPNHVHGIIVITDRPATVGARHSQQTPLSTHEPGSSEIYTAMQSPSRNALPLQRGSLGAIVGNFKSVTARRINRIRHTPGLDVWQRNYYEHIIRNERALQRIREYIINNPLQWNLDIENPDNWQGGKKMDAGHYYASIWGE